MQDDRPLISTDESYPDSSLLGLKAPISKGNRLIIVHAGGKMGFIPNALLLFRSGIILLE